MDQAHSMSKPSMGSLKPEQSASSARNWVASPPGGVKVTSRSAPEPGAVEWVQISHACSKLEGSGMPPA